MEMGEMLEPHADLADRSVFFFQQDCTLGQGEGRFGSGVCFKITMEEYVWKIQRLILISSHPPGPTRCWYPWRRSDAYS